ncbi:MULTISPECIES: hypothetical protein [Nostoc]|uniref:hypothetical protein n=1 Tax=Nostoc TaxID=1177 RepID=UPI0016866860|nr:MULTISPECIES: hypothetical protein [Nostoc]MBD2682531.1 hypothetical protein [Nostoc sp. FACHB-857]
MGHWASGIGSLGYEGDKATRRKLAFLVFSPCPPIFFPCPMPNAPCPIPVIALLSFTLYLFDFSEIYETNGFQVFDWFLVLHRKV